MSTSSASDQNPTVSQDPSSVDATFAKGVFSDAEHETHDSAINMVLKALKSQRITWIDSRVVILSCVIQYALELRPDIYKVITDDEMEALLSDERIQNIIDEDKTKGQYANLRNLGMQCNSFKPFYN